MWKKYWNIKEWERPIHYRVRSLSANILWMVVILWLAYREEIWSIEYTILPIIIGMILMQLLIMVFIRDHEELFPERLRRFYAISWIFFFVIVLITSAISKSLCIFIAGILTGIMWVFYLNEVINEYQKKQRITKYH